MLNVDICSKMDGNEDCYVKWINEVAEKDKYSAHMWKVREKYIKIVDVNLGWFIHGGGVIV